MDLLPNPPLELNDWSDEHDFVAMTHDVDGRETTARFERIPVLNKYYYAVIVDPTVNFGHIESVVQFLGPDGLNRRYRIWKKFHWADEDENEEEHGWFDVAGDETRSLSNDMIRLYIPRVPEIAIRGPNIRRNNVPLPPPLPPQAQNQAPQILSLAPPENQNGAARRDKRRTLKRKTHKRNSRRASSKKRRA